MVEEGGLAGEEGAETKGGVPGRDMGRGRVVGDEAPPEVLKLVARGLGDRPS